MKFSMFFGNSHKGAPIIYGISLLCLLPPTGEFFLGKVVFAGNLAEKAIQQPVCAVHANSSFSFTKIEKK